MSETAIGARLAELPPIGALVLRLPPRSAELCAAALGVALPGPNTWIDAGSAHVLWQAFDEWLLITPDGKQAALATSLWNALQSTHHAITDVSDLRARFSLEGPNARDVLQKGCAVDLHPRVFTSSSCVTTALARVRVTLRRIGVADGYEILVERSYGAYLRDWLADAALEYIA